MDTPKKKQTRRKGNARPRENRTRSHQVAWTVHMPSNNRTITVHAETEIKAVEIAATTYGVIPVSVTKKVVGKREFVRPTNLTHRPFSGLESMLKGA